MRRSPPVVNIALDAAETLAAFMVDGLPDPLRFSKALSDLIVSVSKSAAGRDRRVVICGEGAPLLWAQGNGEAAIRVERLWNEIAKTHRVEALCGYRPSSLHPEEDSDMFDRICAEHSAVSRK